MKHRTTAALRFIALLAATAVLAGCESGPRIVTNSAPDFSLVNHQTFSFLRPLSTDQGNVRSLRSATLIDATTMELENAGLRRDDNNPDLLINFVISTRETIQTRNTPTTGMSMHHGRGRYGTWSGYSMSVSTSEVIQRTEGTLGIDIIAAAERQLVWEGAATQRITDSMQNNRDQVLRNAVADILAKFP